MFQEYVEIFSGLILIKDKKLLLLKKKNTGVRTIPFIKVNNGEYPIAKITKAVESLLSIKIEEENLVKSLVVNKVNEEKEVSIGYFAVNIDRLGDPKLNNSQENYSELNRFEIIDLSKIKITEDLLKILNTIDIGEKYLEL